MTLKETVLNVNKIMFLLNNKDFVFLNLKIQIVI